MTGAKARAPRTVHLPALAWAFLKRDFLIAASYKTAFVGEALGVLLNPNR